LISYLFQTAKRKNLKKTSPQTNNNKNQSVSLYGNNRY
jgi:hypothetical protein